MAGSEYSEAKLNKPYLGFVKNKIDVRQHGITLGATQIGTPDVVIFKNDTPEIYDNDLKRFSENNNDYMLGRSFNLDDGHLKVDVYLRKKILLEN